VRGGGGGEEEGVVRDTTCNGETRDKFTAAKIPRQCPFDLLAKVVGTTFGSRDGRDEKWSKGTI
jgi:hypothetical protein